MSDPRPAQTGPDAAAELDEPTEASPAFAHASEAELSRILDFYAVRWQYEPHVFPILWNTEGDVLESFAPDFYLPDLDLYVEMTTLRQKLVRKKNRKLRRLRELYPDVRIKLFYARDFRAMMLKYGRLALAEALSGTPGQVVPERAADRPAAVVDSAVTEPAVSAIVVAAPTPGAEPAGLPPAVRASARARGARRRRRPRRAAEAATEQETGA